jgi:hypothetical protein
MEVMVEMVMFMNFEVVLSNIQSNLSPLHQLEWSDNQTQSVIIQLSL